MIKEGAILIFRPNLRFVTVLGMLVLLMFAAVGCLGQEAEEPDEAGEDDDEGDRVSEEELAALLDPLRDPSPEGCVGCHKGDYSLANEVAEIEGHPPINEEAELADCLPCHSSESAQPFDKLLHPSHLKSEHFFGGELKGNCMACHIMEKDGTIILKEGGG